MVATTFLSLILSLSGTLVLADTAVSYQKVCNSIKSALSTSSGVFFPGSSQYNLDIRHWANSSTQQSACSVEPGTVEDLSKVLRIIGAARVPFGVKSGGHTPNVGFSSTTGVEIALSRFNEVNYNPNTGTAEVGAGLFWDDVYAALESQNVIVLGARVTQVGVGGLTLGGGYGWKSQQHGLSCDTVVAYDLVLPNGTFTVVTAASQPDLFFGLKGGSNNFGIVTKFTFQAFPQTMVWGGWADFSIDHLFEVTKAIANFAANNRNPKAAIEATYQFVAGVPLVQLLLFFDGVPPPGTTPADFAEFLAIPTTSQDLQTRTFLSMVQAPPGFALQNTRVTFQPLSVVELTEELLHVIANESIFRGAALQEESEVLVAYVVEPYFGVEKFATPSAYPHDTPRMIVNAFYSWGDASKDYLFIANIKESMQTVYNAALAEGQNISIESGNQIRYPNYAPADTPLDQLYGTNVAKLDQIQAAVDPYNIMSLTGGFRFGPTRMRD